MLSEFCQLINEKNIDELKYKMIAIGSEYNIVVIFDDENLEYRNHSTIADVITIGHYKNVDLMVASFFHELGHHVSKFSYDKNQESLKFHQELDAWNHGLIIGQTKGYFIKPDTHRICIEKMLYSYSYYDIREASGYFRTDEARYFYEQENARYFNYYHNVFDFDIDDDILVKSVFDDRWFIATCGKHKADSSLKSDLSRADSKLLKIYHQYDGEQIQDFKNFKTLNKTVDLIKHYETYF